MGTWNLIVLLLEHLPFVVLLLCRTTTTYSSRDIERYHVRLDKNHPIFSEFCTGTITGCLDPVRKGTCSAHRPVQLIQAGLYEILVDERDSGFYFWPCGDVRIDENWAMIWPGTTHKQGYCG